MKALFIVRQNRRGYYEKGFQFGVVCSLASADCCGNRAVLVERGD